MNCEYHRPFFRSITPHCYLAPTWVLFRANTIGSCIRLCPRHAMAWKMRHGDGELVRIGA